MKNDILLSIIIPIYKIKREYLIECLNSINNNSQKNEFEVILVDDGSPDDCGNICDYYSDQSTVFITYHKINEGVSVARNYGIDKSIGKWITFIDPDDWVNNDSIDKLISLLNIIDNKIDIITYNYVREYANNSKSEFLTANEGILDSNMLETCRKAPFYKLIDNGNKSPYSINAIWNKTYRRKFLKENKIRFIPEAKKGQDRLFNALAFSLTKDVYYFKEELYHYRCYEGSVTNRYNPKIVELTEIEINELMRINILNNLKYEELIYARAVTRLYSCFRLYYFNDNNTDSVKKKYSMINKLLKCEVFKKALENINYKLFDLKEKIFVFCLKKRFFFIIRILIKIYNKRRMSL